MSESGTALKPCPFCGYESPVTTTDFGEFCVFCYGCGASTAKKSSTESVITAWNTRLETPAIRHTPFFSEQLQKLGLTKQDVLEAGWTGGTYTPSLEDGPGTTKGPSSYKDFTPFACKADDPKEADNAHVLMAELNAIREMLNKAGCLTSDHLSEFGKMLVDKEGRLARINYSADD